jgi:hypothetical protein
VALEYGERMSWWKNLARYAAPVAGAALGSFGAGELGFSPAIGGALGGALGGFAGGEFTGAGTGASLLEAGLGGVGGYLAGPTIADLTGATPGPSVAGAGTGIGGGSSLDDLLKNMGTGSAAEASIPSIAAEGAVPAIGAAAAPGVATGAAAAGAGGLGGIADFFKNNPALVAGGVGLGAQFLSQPSGDYPAETALNKNAELLGGTGRAGLSGNLTPSAQVAYNDAVTTIKAQYANMGLGGSTMEAQDIAAAKERAVATSAQEGLQELGLSDSLYAQILGYQQQRDDQLSTAISNLMSSIGYGYGAQRQGATG